MSVPTIPSPHDVFGPHALNPAQVYEHAVDAVLGQCHDRLRRGIPAEQVTAFLRGQYIRLSQLAAVVEVVNDQALLAATVSAPPAGTPPVRVKAGNVRYLPFGNAANRRGPSRKAALA